MIIPGRINIRSGALEIRVPLTPEDVRAGRLPKYTIVHNTGQDSNVVASVSVVRTKSESGYDVLRRFNLPGKKPSKIGFSLFLQDADDVAAYRARVLASSVRSARVPIYDFIESDSRKLRRDLRRGA